MEKQAFAGQIRRLVTTYSDRAYPQERVELFWRAFKEISEDVFREAIDECIGNQRQPPMFQELEKAVADAKAREQQRNTYRSSGGYVDVMQEALSRTPNNEFARACVKLVVDKHMGKINMRQFQEGCGILEQAANVMRRK